MLTSGLSLHGQVEVRTQVDKSSYSIGDYIHVTISLTGNTAMTYYWPNEAELATFDIISANPTDTTISGQTITLSKKLIYSIYESGDFYFPQVSIQYSITNDTTRYYAISDSVLIHIEDIAVDTTTAIKPITDVLDVKVRSDLWWKILLAVHLIFIAGFLIWFFVLRKEKTAPVKPAAKVPGLYERTMQQLRALENQKLWQQDQRKAYYSGLTDILRTYLEARFRIQSMERTSDEIMAQLHRHPETKNLAVDIQYVLDLADMAKFAKSQPLPDENVRALTLVINFVEHTKPVETETDAE